MPNTNKMIFKKHEKLKDRLESTNCSYVKWIGERLTWAELPPEIG